MSDQLLAVTDDLARAVMGADASDLSGLADLHSLLERLSAAVPGELGNAPTTSHLDEKITATRKLVEKVILREVADAQAAFNSMRKAVDEIHQLIQGALAGEIPAGSTAAESPAAEAAPATAGVAPEGAAAVEETPAEEEFTIREDDLPLLTEFITEASSHIEMAEAELLKLEAASEDVDAINAVFRAFHTIKGVAGFLNLKEIGKLAHAAENLLDMGRKGQLQITEKCLDIVLESNDAMKRLIGGLDEAMKSRTPVRPDASIPSLIQRLHAIAERKSVPAAAAPSPVAAPSEAPAPASVSADAPAAPAVAAPSAAAPAAESPKATPAPAAAQNAVSATAKSTQGDATVKVATDRLDNLINVVGELVIAHAMASQDMARVATTDQRLLRNMSQLAKITRELQDLSMSMRMVPIQGVFQKMTRLVRDLARKAGKEIELVLIGSETELDRNVVEAISDPLVHMVRNAADHGIECPEDRITKGKPRSGRIELKAYHQAGNIVIEITDDGKGLNKERILRKAKEAGIVRDGQELSEQEIFRLIFHAGLSTAEKITDVSGRGVGMDVVRKNVEALRGRIDITSVEGKGSTFTIRLPLTLAVIDGLIINIGKDRFILPITSVEQSLRPKQDQLSTMQGRGEMCMVRGQLLPLIRLHRLFNIVPQNDDPTKALVVIVHDNERRCCLLVDELVGQQQVVIKSLGKTLGQVQGTSGGAIMGDGCVSLILDVPGIIDLVGRA